jgi:hypothetical protein
MRRLGAIVLALALAEVPALAYATQTLCMDGKWVPGRSEACRHHGGPAQPEARHHHGVSRQPPPRARCRDGSVQFASEHTCKHRGGIEYWM